MLLYHPCGGTRLMRTILKLFLLCLAAFLMIGVAAAETRISMPTASISTTTTLPLSVSGLSGSPGLEFDLFYNSNAISIEKVARTAYVSSVSFATNIDNSAGHAHILMISTRGITTNSLTPVINITYTVKSTGSSELRLENAIFSDDRFNSVPFDVVTNGMIIATLPSVPQPEVTTMAPGQTQVPANASSANETTPQPAGTAIQPGSPAPAAGTTSPPGTVEFELPEYLVMPAVPAEQLPGRAPETVSPAPAVTGAAGIPAPAITTGKTPAPTLTPGEAPAPVQTITGEPSLPAGQQPTPMSPGFSCMPALGAAGLAALVYCGCRRIRRM